MSDDWTTLQVDGLAEMDRKLGEMTNALAGKALYGALSYALTPVIKDQKQLAAKANEPHTMTYPNGKTVEVQPGLLATASRKRRVPKSEMVGDLATGAAMGTYIGKGSKQKIYPRYWFFVEYGTVNQPATPFIRPSFDNNIDVMLDRFGSKLNENIDKYTE